MMDILHHHEAEIKILNALKIFTPYQLSHILILSTPIAFGFSSQLDKQRPLR